MFSVLKIRYPPCAEFTKLMMFQHCKLPFTHLDNQMPPSIAY